MFGFLRSSKDKESNKGGRKAEKRAKKALQLRLDQPLMYFAVYDGHGGSEVSKLCAAVLPGAIAKRIPVDYTPKDLAKAVKDTCLKLDAKLIDDKFGLGSEPGSTAIMALVSPTHFVVGNVGDSRAILCREGGETVAMSRDHKPNLPKERARIERAGADVEHSEGDDWRVGGLAMSRSIGDVDLKQVRGRSQLKQPVVADPEFAVRPNDNRVAFMVVACDGIFDVKTNSQVVSFVKSRLDRGMSLKKVAKALLNDCLEPVVDPDNLSSSSSTDSHSRGIGAAQGSTDNMSAILIRFKTYNPLAAKLATHDGTGSTTGFSNATSTSSSASGSGSGSGSGSATSSSALSSRNGIDNDLESSMYSSSSSSSSTPTEISVNVDTDTLPVKTRKSSKSGKKGKRVKRRGKRRRRREDTAAVAHNRY